MKNWHVTIMVKYKSDTGHDIPIDYDYKKVPARNAKSALKKATRILYTDHPEIVQHGYIQFTSTSPSELQT